jgi:sulfatase modifying factor 1
MSRLTMLAFLGAILLGFSTRPLLADAEADFQEVFGTKARKVAATGSTRDDAEFAAALLDAAKDVGDRRDLQILLYEKAADFGAKDLTGCETALQAVQYLMVAVPARQEDWHEKILNVYQLRFSRGKPKERVRAANQLMEQLLVVAEGALARGEATKANGLFRRALYLAKRLRSPNREQIADRFNVVAAGMAVERRRKYLEQRLQGKGEDVGVREALIRLYLLELNSPARAAKLVRQDISEELRTYVPMAAKPVTDLPEAACLELAAWYEKLAKTAPAAAGVTALRRAGSCYQQYLAVHEKEDMPRLKAKVALSEVEKKLAKAGAALFVCGGEQMVLELAENVPMKLVHMPAGSFLMGSPKDEKGRGKEEGPQHLVTISRPFYMGVTEVTVGQFAAFVAATRYVTTAEKDGWASVKGRRGWRRGAGISWRKCVFDQTPAHPVVCVTWHDAVAFCQWLSKKTGRTVRLPTEAEWEYACRAGTKSPFHFGDDEKQLASYAWYGANSGRRTHPVGLKRPNAAGLCDMMGNVLEWCGDWYGAGYSPQTPGIDPKGPASGENRVRRGMAYHHGSHSLRSAARSYATPTGRQCGMGFRVVVSSRPPGGSAR